MANPRLPRYRFARFVYLLIRPLLRWLVRPSLLPRELADLKLDRGKPICYVLESDALSYLLILQQVADQRDCHGPLSPLLNADGSVLRPASVLCIQRLRGFFWRRPDARSHLTQLEALTEAVEVQSVVDVQMLPVSIFLGRAPERDWGVMKILVSENWPVAGRFRRLLSVFVHGKHATLVQFNRPLSLQTAVRETKTTERAARKVSRVLRVHFRRAREAAIGPDLSHRRTLVDELLSSRAVGEALRTRSRRRGTPLAKLEKKARRMAYEIAADFSYPAIRVYSRVLTWFWNRIYDGVSVHHLNELEEVVKGNEVIYVPCHRSHIDYLLVSYLVYHNGIAVPHIAAGVNLNLPILGPILRKGGAFFLRRSFKSDALYASIFTEYVHTLLGRGISMEYFIEGTRSRTGRLLDPKLGMLSMTVQGQLRNPQRSVVFQPIYIGYERLPEAGAYVGELSGGKKRKESLLGFFRAFSILRERFGRVHLNLGKPIYLPELLEKHSGERFPAPPSGGEKPAWLSDTIEELGEEILTRINAAADINPINLLALTLLSTPKFAMAESDLIAQIRLCQQLLRMQPYSDMMTLTNMPAPAIIRYGEQLGAVSREQHELGDVIMCEPKAAVLLSYFRNNIMHTMAATSWCAVCFLNNASFERDLMMRLGKLLYPFLETELKIRFDADEFIEVCEKVIEHFFSLGLLVGGRTSGRLRRAPGGTAKAMQLKSLGRMLFPSLERYYITLALLIKNGSGTLSTAELEDICHLTAERLSLLYEISTPEFFDRRLFQQFIRTLKQTGTVRTNEEGKLVYDTRLEQVIQEAKNVLSKEVRHAIWQLAPEREKLAGVAA